MQTQSHGWIPFMILPNLARAKEVYCACANVLEQVTDGLVWVHPYTHSEQTAEQRSCSGDRAWDDDNRSVNQKKQHFHLFIVSHNHSVFVKLIVNRHREAKIKAVSMFMSAYRLSSNAASCCVLSSWLRWQPPSKPAPPLWTIIACRQWISSAAEGTVQRTGGWTDNDLCLCSSFFLNFPQ